MNHYEAKQEARRQRIAAAATRAAEASDAAYTAARQATAGIEFGQPILVGHHSEGRHRRDLAKMARNMDKSVALSKKAASLAAKADAVGTGGISSDDPEAVAKLTDKRTDLERQRDHMKAVNAAYRKKDSAALLALTGADYPAWAAKVASNFSWDKRPYAAYELTNIGARIRQAAKRTEHIEAVASLTPTTETIGTATVAVDPDDNRVTIVFPERLPRDQYKTLRAHGFLWSPSRGGFTRKITGTAVFYARKFAAEFTATN